MDIAARPPDVTRCMCLEQAVFSISHRLSHPTAADVVVVVTAVVADDDDDASAMHCCGCVSAASADAATADAVFAAADAATKFKIEIRANSLHCSLLAENSQT